ncbi:MAG: class I SAM-dependent methyltransferase, partial [Altererythrobacter sp.]|nr:class I SAM-dependent methyltransferase [Altererythrobacter sp.]
MIRSLSKISAKTEPGAAAGRKSALQGNRKPIGCGSGGTAITHARHVAHVTATDVSGKMLEFAKKNAAEAGIDNVTFSATSIESFEAPDGSFDAVLMLSLLHLLENPGAALDKARRL